MGGDCHGDLMPLRLQGRSVEWLVLEVAAVQEEPGRVHQAAWLPASVQMMEEAVARDSVQLPWPSQFALS